MRNLSPPVHEYHPTNVHIWNDSGEYYLGGLWQSPHKAHITKANFYHLVEIACVFTPADVAWAIWDAEHDGSTSALVQRTPDLQPSGGYLVLASLVAGQAVQVVADAEQPVRRVPTQQKSTGALSSHAYFRNVVRARDGACAISGRGLISAGDYLDKAVAHVYPVAKWQLWNQHGWRDLVTDDRPATEVGASKMYSPQNGLLLDLSIHRLFSQFRIGVGPDNSYKIICFSKDVHEVSGRTLAVSARQPANPQDTVTDGLLRWHFRQCVLTNMAGAGAPRWEESDFGEHDKIGQVVELGDGALRMEEELYNRLGPSMGGQR